MTSPEKGSPFPPHPLPHSPTHPLTSTDLLPRLSGSIPSTGTLEDAAALPPQYANGRLQPPPGIDEKALLRKIDFRLLPVLCILYLLAFLDRWVFASLYSAHLEGKGWTDGISVNISNAAVFGLKEELKLGGLEYNTCLTIFFVPYICLFRPPPPNPPLRGANEKQYLKSRRTYY